MELGALSDDETNARFKRRGKRKRSTVSVESFTFFAHERGGSVFAVEAWKKMSGVARATRYVYC